MWSPQSIRGQKPLPARSAILRTDGVSGSYATALGDPRLQQDVEEGGRNPVAAGAAARILSENPNFGAEEVKGIIIRNATRGIVVLGSSSVLYTVTYNRLLRLH